MEKRRQALGTLRMHSLETDQVTTARIAFFDQKYVIVYKEEGEEWKGTSARMSIDVSDPENPLLRIVRKGRVASDYAFVSGKKTEGFYRFPEGELGLEVDTSELKVSVQERGLNVALSAWMTLQNSEAVPLQILLDLTWEEYS